MKPILRIISGRYKQQPILSPPSSSTHPMGAREKLALFNILQSHFLQSIDQREPFMNLVVLDAFAGTGALGIETLSRGAKSVYFIEQNPQTARTLQQTLQNLKPAPYCNKNSSQSNNTDFMQSVQVLVEKVEKIAQNPRFLHFFDLIFADPPYDHFGIETILKLPKLLKPNGILVLSFPARIGETPELPDSSLLVKRQYAAAGIAIYQKNHPHKTPSLQTIFSKTQ